MVVLQWSFGGGGGGGGEVVVLPFRQRLRLYYVNRRTYDINPLSHTTSFY